MSQSQANIITRVYYQRIRVQDQRPDNIMYLRKHIMFSKVHGSTSHKTANNRKKSCKFLVQPVRHSRCFKGSFLFRCHYRGCIKCSIDFIFIQNWYQITY